MTTRRRAHRGGVGGYEPVAVVTARAARAWELEAMGRSQREIAAELGVSQPAVSKMLRRMADQIAAAHREDAGRHQVRALNREDYLYREALRGYERSQADQTRRRQRQITDAEGVVVQGVVEVDMVGRDGDPRFLEQAGRALERTAALQGLTHGRSRPTAGGDTEAVRRRLARELDRLAAAAPPPPVDRGPE